MESAHLSEGLIQRSVWKGNSPKLPPPRPSRYALDLSRWHHALVVESEDSLDRRVGKEHIQSHACPSEQVGRPSRASR